MQSNSRQCLWLKEKCLSIVYVRSETSVHGAVIVAVLDLDEEVSGHAVHELDEWLVKNHGKILTLNVKVENLKGILPRFAEQASSGLDREVTVSEIEGFFRTFLEPQTSKAGTEGDHMRAELDKHGLLISYRWIQCETHWKVV